MNERRRRLEPSGWSGRRGADPHRAGVRRPLAWHYGFTGEELDFILNYDIKYRMGQDAAGDEEA
jgi:hypothetical protein